MDDVGRALFFADLETRITPIGTCPPVVDWRIPVVKPGYFIRFESDEVAPSGAPTAWW
jgi:hypothetical protein